LRRLAHRFGGDAPKLRHRNRVKITAEPDAHDRRVAQVRVLIDERNNVPVGISPSNWSTPRSGSPGCGPFGNRLAWMLHAGDHPDDMDSVGAERPSWAPEDIGPLRRDADDRPSPAGGVLLYGAVACLGAGDFRTGGPLRHKAPTGQGAYTATGRRIPGPMKEQASPQAPPVASVWGREDRTGHSTSRTHASTRIASAWAACTGTERKSACYRSAATFAPPRRRALVVDEVVADMRQPLGVGHL
jgi:hypothetical protein